VHCNIANIVTTGDTSVQSVITYAVEHLHVKCIVVCRHTGCRGVSAVIDDCKFEGPLELWLEPLRKLKHEYAGQYRSLDGNVEYSKRVESLVRFNIQAATAIVNSSSIVQEAKKVRQLDILAAIYDVEKGKLQFFM
jgi:carbonic anhydrase